MAEVADANDKISLIRKQPLFSQLTGDELDVLSSIFFEARFKPKETIVQEGDPVDSILIIVSGQAEVQHTYVKDNTLKVESLATLNPGDTIGLNEYGFYSLSGLRTATVIAKTDIVALKLSVAAFHGFTLTHPRVNQMMRENAKKWE